MLGSDRKCEAPLVAGAEKIPMMPERSFAEKTSRQSCPACAGVRLRRYCERGDYHIVPCGECGLIFLQEIVPASYLAEYCKGHSSDLSAEITLVGRNNVCSEGLAF